MALSEDAKGIIAEIRSQANTTRHKSEQYSLKAIRADLSKFQGVFDAMNANLSLMTGNAEAAADAAARQAALAQLSEDERAKLARDAASRDKRENDLKNRDLKLREREMKKKERSDFKIFGKDGILGNMFGGVMGLVKKALFIGIGGSILYELTAGFLERFGVDLPPIADVAKKFGDLATSVDWEDLKKNLNELAAADFAGLASTIALGVAATKAGPAIGGALELAKDVTILGLLRKMITPDADDVDAAGKEGDKSGKISGKRMAARGLRLGIAGLVFTGLSAVMPAVENLFREHALGMTKDEIANARVDGVDIAGNAITSLAGLLIPGGPIVKLVATVGMFAFKTLGDYLEQMQDNDVLSNKAKDVVAEKSRADKQLEQLLDTRKKLVKLGGDPDAIDAEIAKLKAQVAEKARTQLTEAAAETAARLAQAEERLSKAGVPTLEDVPLKDFVGGKGKSPGQYRELTDEERIERLRSNIDNYMRFYVKPVEDLRAQLQGSIDLAEKYNVTPEDLGLVKRGDRYMTVEQDAAARRESLEKQARARREQKIVDWFNKQLLEDESRAAELAVQGEAQTAVSVYH